MTIQKPTTWCYIEVEAEGWPRHIGPFGSPEAAEIWMGIRSFTGSWNIVPLTDPRTEANYLGRP